MKGFSQHKVLSAIEMMAVLKRLNQKRMTEAKPENNIGIGIASGTVMARYAGTQHRVIYTCVGNAVNLAARIERYTREVNRPILID